MNYQYMKTAGVALLCVFASAFCSAQTYKLENGKIRFEVDSKGNLVSLKNLVDNREYAGGEGLWRIIYQDGLSMEESVDSESVPVAVKKDGEKIILSYGGEFPVKIECRLEGDEVRFVPEIKNVSKDKVLREFQFPMLKNAKLNDNCQLYWTAAGGTYFPNIRGWLMSGYRAYMAQDNKAIEQYTLYPGETAMNYYVINEPKNALYVASHDPNFEKTLHLVRTRKIGGAGEFTYGGIDFAMVKYPFLSAGQSKTFPEYVVSAHSGDWHVSAKKYRKWADTWYVHKPVDETVKNSNGWQRIIMRHQYGKQFFRYDQLPEICKTGLEAGLDTIFMFGWWKEGMDAGYPDYTADDTQGGDEALKKYIKEVQKMGGKVNVYFNGQLIDMDTKFYREKGCKLSVKKASGTEHMEVYPFGGDGTGLRVFGNKTFATACPACPEWLDILKGYADRAIALGADGVFFDQLGYKSELCWDKTHGHPVPAADIMKYKSEMLKKLREYVNEKKPDMSFGIEWMCDPTSMYVDYVHNCGVNLHIAGKDKNGVPVTRYAPMYQYTFPETVTTDRDIYNNQDVPRRNNLAVMRGWRTDAAVYRCRATVDETPVYKEYLTKVNKLRDRFRDTILNGTFCDTDMAKSDSPQVPFTTFTAGDKMAVVASQSHLESAKAVITAADGYEYVEHGGIGDFSVSGDGAKATVELKRDAIVVIVFKKK